MNKSLSVILKFMLIGLIAILLISIPLLGLKRWYFDRSAGDPEMIDYFFKPAFPGYSSIEILKRTEDGAASNPRILTVQVVLESYADAVTCQGEITQFQADSSYINLVLV